MTVRRRLLIALALHIALLAGLLIYHVRTIHTAVATAHELSDVSARLVLVSARQEVRLGQIEENAAKLAVTRDRGYLTKFLELRTQFDTELEQVRLLQLSEGERIALDALDEDWSVLRIATSGIATWVNPRVALGGRIEELRVPLDNVHARLDIVSRIAQETMRSRLAASAGTAQRATTISWFAALFALLLAGATAVVLVRSITQPLNKLMTGTHHLAHGRFDYRLSADGRDEFAKVAGAFNSMAERLGDLDRMKRDFVSTVGHDLKSPLASLRETTTLLLDGIPGPLTESQQRLLVMQRESADRLSRMIAKLLDLSHLDAGLPLIRDPFELGDLLRSVASHGTIMGTEKGIAVRFVGETAHMTRPLINKGAIALKVVVDGDGDRLRALFDNLVENAIKFSPPSSEVDIGMDTVDDTVVVSVADRGPGVPDEERGRIFERFYQTRDGRAIPARGVGLGLAISKAIIEGHSGSISVRDREGGGSVFEVVLPAVESARVAA